MSDGYFKWEYVIDYFPELLKKLPVTLSIVLIATVVGCILGGIIAFIRIERIPVLNQIAIVFISYVRGTPILVQMFIVYYGFVMFFQSIGINIALWDRIWFIYITYSTNISGFLAEIFRGAINSVPKKQMDAAISIGHTRVQAYFRVIVPQSIVIALPTLGYTIIALFQDSTLAFIFGIVDVIGEVSHLAGSTGHMLEGYLDAAIIFACISILLEKLFGYLEKKTYHQLKVV
ncbi:MAG: amino acid ABC transporter permease [Clostridiales Family XIII bacterium]|jgi:L-cystine transport system permease protein|nr:amino acid ABC transporter permease [Clostridiales Family XIII bacterium]